MSKKTTDPLMVTISGIRGIAGTSMNVRVIEKFVGAFADLQKSTYSDVKEPMEIIVGRDSRVSGPWIEKLVHGILMGKGLHVIDIGIVPTPTVQFMVQERKAKAGGIVITSSHNPIEWNGLKFVDQDGLFLSPDRCDELFGLADAQEEGLSPVSYARYDESGTYRQDLTANQAHIDAILALPYMDVPEIQKRKFKVCLDTVNGAGGPIMASLLEQLGCEVIPLNQAPTGFFAHPPEPIPAHLDQLCQAVKEHQADLGIATDPDVDRCVLIDETGQPLGEEYTLVLACAFMLKYAGKRGVVCKNCATSKAINDIVDTYDRCSVMFTPVGEIQVATRMVREQAIFGGEGNGGVMLPDIHIGRDAPVAAALTLQHLLLFGKSISTLKASMPQYSMVKLKAPIAGVNPEQVIDHFRKEWSKIEGGSLSEMDGLRLETNDYWVLFRKSNTEPIIRIMGEGKDAVWFESFCQDILNTVESFKKP